MQKKNLVLVGTHHRTQRHKIRVKCKEANKYLCKAKNFLNDLQSSKLVGKYTNNFLRKAGGTITFSHFKFIFDYNIVND